MKKNKQKKQVVENKEEVKMNTAEEKDTMNDYFNKYYKAYKNDYISQYYKAYKDLKAKQKAEGKD